MKYCKKIKINYFKSKSWEKNRFCTITINENYVSNSWARSQFIPLCYLQSWIGKIYSHYYRRF